MSSCIQMTGFPGHRLTYLANMVKGVTGLSDISLSPQPDVASTRSKKCRRDVTEKTLRYGTIIMMTTEPE